MRRRLTLAIVGLVAGTLVLTAAGGLFFTARAGTSTAEAELTAEAQTIGTTLDRQELVQRRTLATVQKVGSYSFLGVVGITPQGTFTFLPPPLQPALANPAAVQAGNMVVGHVGRTTVYALVPVTLDALQKRTLGGLPVQDQAVLVLVRHVRSPVSGLSYFLFVGLGVLALAAALAVYLARRITSPLLRAVEATRRIAGGDLEARVTLSPGDDPELAELAHAINAMGDSLSRAKGLERQFLLSVSHELRTPLTSIRGYADAVADGVSDDVPGAMAVIGAEARRLERLVQDLLDMARLDAQRFSFAARRIDCVPVLATVVEGFRPQAAELGLRLECHLPGEALWVDADPDRLGQIVANLVENAFKYAAHRVVVGAGRVAASSALWVVDDGPGIAPEDLPRVFDRHYRSDRAPARRIGTGLGLAIVAELAAAMGMTVRAESPVADGVGTRMVLWLTPRPAPDADAVPGPPAARTS